MVQADRTISQIKYPDIVVRLEDGTEIEGKVVVALGIEHVMATRMWKKGKALLAGRAKKESYDDHSNKRQSP
jgi:hypothetical protein